jgi:hypothetical protein
MMLVIVEFLVRFGLERRRDLFDAIGDNACNNVPSIKPPVGVRNVDPEAILTIIAIRRSLVGKGQGTYDKIVEVGLCRLSALLIVGITFKGTS